MFSTPHPEVAGPLTTESNEITLDPYHNKLHTKIRRCIVVRDMSSHCLCVPVNTYGGRDNYTAKPQDRYQLFPAIGNWDKSRIAKKELPLVVEASDVDVDYNLASVDFTRILTVKHYALVKKIGRIDKLGLPLLEECFRNALGVPLELDDTNVSQFCLQIIIRLDLKLQFSTLAQAADIVPQASFCVYVLPNTPQVVWLNRRRSQGL